MTGKKDTTGDGETPTRTKNFFESSVANSTGMVVAVVAQRFRHVFADSWRTRDDHTRVRGSWQTSHWDATVDFDGKRSSNDGLMLNKHLHSQRHKKEWPSRWQEEQRRRGSSRNVHFVFERALNRRSAVVPRCTGGRKAWTALVPREQARTNLRHPLRRAPTKSASRALVIGGLLRGWLFVLLLIMGHDGCFGLREYGSCNARAAASASTQMGTRKADTSTPASPAWFTARTGGGAPWSGGRRQLLREETRMLGETWACRV